MDKKVTRKALWASGLSIIISLAMLLGVTFAWFSDVASNKGNVITSGNLAISVIGYNATGGDPVNFKDDHDPIINESNWEPGLSNTKFVKIENIGTLGLKYNLTFVTYDQGLQEALWYKITEATTLPGGSAPTFEEREQMGLISSDIQDGDLIPGESIIYRIDYGMNESAGNTYMDKGFSADIIVTATQTNDDAKVVKAYTVHDIETAAQNDTVVLMKDITLDKNLAINTNINLDTNGYEFNLGGFSLTFGQTTYYATYDIKGVFKNGIIILDNSNGHFNMTGDAGTDADIVVENTYESSAVLSGQWGNVNVNDTNGRTYIKGRVGNINTGSGSKTIISPDAVVEGGISGDGDISNEEGYPIATDPASLAAAFQKSDIVVYKGSSSPYSSMNWNIPIGKTLIMASDIHHDTSMVNIKGGTVRLENATFSTGEYQMINIYSPFIIGEGGRLASGGQTNVYGDSFVIEEGGLLTPGAQWSVWSDGVATNYGTIDYSGSFNAYGELHNYGTIVSGNSYATSKEHPYGSGNYGAVYHYPGSYCNNTFFKIGTEDVNENLVLSDDAVISFKGGHGSSWVATIISGTVTIPAGKTVSTSNFSGGKFVVNEGAAFIIDGILRTDYSVENNGTFTVNGDYLHYSGAPWELP